MGLPNSLRCGRKLRFEGNLMVSVVDNSVATVANPILRADVVGWRARVADYWSLTKPEVNSLVVASSLAGFYLAWRGPMDYWLLFNTLAGTLLVASGTATLNQWYERKS